MKKLLGIIVLGLLLSGNAYAEIKIIERIGSKGLKSYDGSKAKSPYFAVTRICADGLEFLITASGQNTSVVQVFESRGGTSLPKTCLK